MSTRVAIQVDKILLELQNPNILRQQFGGLIKENGIFFDSGFQLKKFIKNVMNFRINVYK